MVFSKVFKLSSLFIGLTLVCPFMAQAGPGGTGGGDVQLSSPRQVEDAISSAKSLIVEWLKVYQIHFNSITSEAAISKLYKDFFSLKGETQTPISIWSIEHSKLKIKKDGPCKDLKGNEKDAAVQEQLEPGSPICLSVPRLTRIPSDQLERQITALVAHELTHQILRTMDEEWPVKIQQEVLETYASALAKDVTCGVNSFRNYKGEVTHYQINFGFLLDCSGGCGTGFSFPKEDLSYYMELARKRHLDPLGRSVGCTNFKFID